MYLTLSKIQVSLVKDYIKVLSLLSFENYDFVLCELNIRSFLFILTDRRNDVTLCFTSCGNEKVDTSSYFVSQTYFVVCIVLNQGFS